MKRTLVELLSGIRWPATKITSAQDWNCEIELANNRLHQAKEREMLFKSGKHYIPTPELLGIWQDRGLI